MDKASELRVAERYRRSGDLDRAVASVQALVSEIPDDTSIRRRLADILIESGNRDSAISELVKIQERLAFAGDILGAIAADLKVVELDPPLENPLAYIAKVTVDSLRAEQKRQKAQTVPVPTLTPLDDIPLLSELTPEELSSVAGAMKRHELEEGSVVFDEGDAGGSLFFVTRGLLEVRADDAKLAVVSAGQCLGEFSFLTGDPRTASVRCLAASELLELSADRMRGVVANHRRLREVLFSMYRDRALVNVLSQSPLFEMLPSKDRARLAPRFKLVTLAEGQTAFQEGEHEGTLYLIKEGSVVVEVKIRDELIELARLGNHQFFGEVSFLTGVPRTATVHSLEDGTELLKIEEKELKELLRHHPYMKDVLSRYHLDRVTATADTLKSFLKNENVEGIVS